jgi:hypothetical protein
MKICIQNGIFEQGVWVVATSLQTYPNMLLVDPTQAQNRAFWAR